MTSSSKNSQRLKVDFYESGIGETIVITFPSGGIALVDAHPSSHQFRPDILKIIDGKKLHFVCLTHPHADHGVDLVKVLQNKNVPIEAFWHTIFEVPAFIYGIEQTVSFPSAVRKYAKRMNQQWAEFLFDIYASVLERKIALHLLRSDLAPHEIDGVEVHCLGPEESVQNAFASAYRKKLSKPDMDVPNPNLLSAILALRLGRTVVLLGGDALRQNWDKAIELHHKRSLPKAMVLKVPHHGARNALSLQKSAKSYLDICSHSPRAKAVIFAGDTKHPDSDVFEKLRARAETVCLSNGQMHGTKSNPLHLQLPGARGVYPAPVCNPVISLEVDAAGNLTTIAGVTCKPGCLPR